MRKLFVLLIISLLPLALSAQSVEVDGLWYTLDATNATAEVTSSGGSTYSGKVVIPATITSEEVTYNVKSIGASSFRSSSIDTLIISSGVESIGEYAFYNCNSLKKVELASTLNSIGKNAFCALNNLTIVVSKIATPINISVTVFSRSYSLENYNSDTQQYDTICTASTAKLFIPDNTKTAYQAIAGWTNFADIIEGEPIDVTIDGLKYLYVVGPGTAIVTGRADENLRNVFIPSVISVEGSTYDVKSIGERAFYDISLDTVTIANGVEAIEDYAFWDSDGINSLTLPSTLKTIGNRAFTYGYFSSLVLPEGLVSIGEGAFLNCSRFTSIELPSTLESIGKEAFRGLSNLKTVISRIQTPIRISGTVFCNSYSWSNWDSEAQKYDTTFVASNATLYVPDNTKAAYQAIEGWTVFADIVEGNPKEATVDGLNYFYLEGKGNATVIGRADENLKNITIPSSIPVDGYTYNVKTIADRALERCYIDTLIISEGVETIGDYSFQNNYYMKLLTLPTSLRSMGKYAFYNCYNLTELLIPQGVETIGEWAFNGCSSLKKVDLPSTLQSIGQHAFRSIGSNTSVISRIQTPFDIKGTVFCESFREENWNSETQTYDSIYTASKATLYVPVGTKTAYQAIQGWTMFADIIEGEPVETTVDGLNYLCVVGAGTATVTGRADETLRNITIPSTIPYEGSTYSVKTIANSALSSCSIDTLVISQGVETIGDNAFEYNYNLKSLTLPSSLRTIGNRAFYYCSYNLANLVIPQGVETIGENAFRYCRALKRVELGSTIKSIGEFAFYNLNNLKTVVSRIQTPFDIKGTVFCQSYSTSYNSETEKYDTTYTASPATLCVPVGTLAAYQAIQGWTVFTDIVEGELIEITSGDLAYLINADRKTATVIKGTNYRNLTNVNIPSTFMYEDSEYSVKDIDSNAFEETNITSLRIGEGVLKIGDYAFQNCTRMSSMSLPSTLTSIGEAAFRYCYQLSSIAIPASLTSIGDMAFTACTNVSSIVVAEGNTVYNSQGSNSIIETATNKLILGCKNSVIPDGVTEIGFEAFFNCQMTSMKIPSSVKTIGQEAFTSCGKLTEMILPEGVDSVSMNAFNDCYAMRTLQLPNSLRVMEYGAFGNCRGLENVVSYIENPTDLSEEVFGNDEDLYKQATLWVPKGKIATYQEKEGWKRFTLFDELLGDILTKPAVSYNGHYLVLTVPEAERAAIYYSSDGSEPTTLYTDTVSIYNIGVIKAISKRFGSFTVDTTSYDIQYVFDGITAKTAVGGVLANAFEWCGTGNVEKLDIVGTLNDDDFATIRSFAKLNTLDMSAAKLPDNALPSGAFADTKLVYYTAPSTLSAVGSNIFRGCNQLAAITWNSSTVELPEDVATDVANPNMLVYATTLSMIPYSIKNVVINGVANNILLADSTGNNNFYCPESFLARRISYTHNYQQKTSIGKSQGWETIALPFTVAKITHEKNGELTPAAVEDAEKPFWLFELGDNGMEAATQIKANIPYLICMPNNDAYGDEYIQGGRVTFTAQNVQISTSRGITVTQGDRRFVPTYQRVDASADVYVLNVGQEVDGNAEGSVFVANLREVRPFEAYSIHTVNRSRIISVSSLGGGDATGISNPQLGGESANEIVKVYTLSGIFLKQGPRGDVLRSLPKGVYIINGKKVIK